MITEQIERQKVNEFVRLVNSEDEIITSTGAVTVNFSGGLYNVKGSTPDPKKVPNHEGVAWKQLLIDYGISAANPCYVTNPGAEGSHPDFSVGGHMTTSYDGNVPTGGSCYLMPLCYWHNSKSRDEVLFYHVRTAMLLLTGYMQGELAATFHLRLPCSEPFGLLYNIDGGWRHHNFATKEQVDTFLAEVNGGHEVEHHLFERYLHGQTLKLVSVS